MIDLLSDAEIISVSADAEHYLVQLTNPTTVERLKLVAPGCKRDRETGFWKVPANSFNTQALHGLGLSWSGDALKHAMFVHADELERIEQSKAASGDIHIEGFKKKPYPFQMAGIKYALDRKRVIIGDEMGLGKTLMGLGTVYAANAFPCLVVTPASLKYNWAENEIPACMPDKRVLLADKDTPELLLRMADIIVTNYEQLVGFRTYISDGKKKRSSWADGTKKQVVLSPLAERLLGLGLVSIICDEAHYLKEGDAARTRAAREVRKGTTFRVLLTGTPMLNNVSEFASLLQFIDRIDEFGGWWNFMTQYCGLKKGRFGYETDPNHNPRDLNERLRSSCYVRRRKKDVLTELPDKQRGNVQVEIDNRDEYIRAEKQLLQWVKERVRQNKDFMASIAHLPPAERELAIAVRQAEKMEAAERGEQMVRIQALKDVTARGKLNAAKEWIDNFLASGEKLVVFATHKVILRQLMEWYPNAAHILGEDSPQERQEQVKRFQEDPTCQLLVGAQGTSATNSPAGVGHTLTSASTVLTIELGWNNALHDQCEDRTHRIGQKDTVNAYYMLGRNTIDIDIAELIESKRSLSMQVVDGIGGDDEDSILDELMHRLESKCTDDEILKAV